MLIRAHLEHMGRVVKRNVIVTMEPRVIMLMGDVSVCQATPDLWYVMSYSGQIRINNLVTVFLCDIGRFHEHFDYQKNISVPGGMSVWAFWTGL